MKYYSLSKNIIACNNFLPQQKVEELYTDLLNTRNNFGIPKWSPDDVELFSEKCGGLDFWFSNKTKEDNNSFIESLHKWFLHQGLFFYAEKNASKVYDFLKRNLEWNIHVISYNDGGYYNWHTDHAMSTLFTFNLILNKESSLQGGNMLFYDEKIIEVENTNNLMVVFPSYIPHAITPLYTNNKKDVSFLEQRFSIQFWVRFKQ
jgi:Rps23 Pro-64 3,4-dihydroxylase Tpa1-like proline 4-hydroxylase